MKVKYMEAMYIGKMQRIYGSDYNANVYWSYILNGLDYI